MLTIHLNGQLKTLDELSAPASISSVVVSLGMRVDRIAVEHNGTIVPRTKWQETIVASGDRIEVVQFVGGGFDR